MQPDQAITKGTFLDRGLYHWMGEQKTASVWGIIELDAPLSGVLIEKSLKLLIESVPTLSARLELGLWRSWWKYTDPGDISRLIQYKNVKTKEQADQLLKDVIHNHVHIDDPPLFKITAINAPKTHYLALQVHHLVADGEGAKQLFMLFAEFYRELEKNPGWRPSSTPEISRGWGQVMKYVKWRWYFMAPFVHAVETLSMLMFVITRQKKSGVIKGDLPGVTESLSPVEPFYETLEIDRASLEKMKKPNVKVNDVIMAALMTTVNTWNQSLGKKSSHIVSGYTADLRRWWGQPAGTFANLSIIRLISLKAKKVDNVHHAVQNFKAKMNKAKKRFGIKEIWDLALMSLQPAFLGKIVGRLFPKLAKQIHALTNIGIIPESAGDFGSVKAVSYSLLAPPQGSPGIAFTASSYKDHLIIHGDFDAIHLKKETAEKFMALFKKNILIYAYVNPVQVIHDKRNEISYSDLDNYNEALLNMETRSHQDPQIL